LGKASIHEKTQEGTIWQWLGYEWKITKQICSHCLAKGRAQRGGFGQNNRRRGTHGPNRTGFGCEPKVARTNFGFGEVI
jgi:hypothetical protein